MEQYKLIIARVLVFALLVLGWSRLNRLGLFVSPVPHVLSVQDEARVGEQRGYVAAELVNALPASALGVFLYANNEARFYPFQVLLDEGVKNDSVGGVSFVLSGVDTVSASVEFPKGVSVPYEFTTLSEARYEFPGVMVYVGK